MAVSTRNEVRQVLLITLVLNLLVAFSKIGIGTLTGALAILADGFHSLVDGSSNVVALVANRLAALVANRLAARPPDADHPYGHRRYETVAALGIGAFLLVVAWEIFSSALGRLMGESSEPTLTPLSFIIMLVTLLVNIGITTYETQAAACNLNCSRLMPLIPALMSLLVFPSWRVWPCKSLLAGPGLIWSLRE